MSTRDRAHSDRDRAAPDAVPVQPLSTQDRDRFIDGLHASGVGREIADRQEEERFNAQRRCGQELAKLQEQDGPDDEREARIVASLAEKAVKLRQEWMFSQEAADRAQAEFSQRNYGRGLRRSAVLRTIEQLARPELDQAIAKLEEQHEQNRRVEPPVVGQGDRLSYPHCEGIRRAQQALMALKGEPLGKVEVESRIAAILAMIPPCFPREASSNKAGH